MVLMIVVLMLVVFLLIVIIIVALTFGSILDLLQTPNFHLPTNRFQHDQSR